MGDARSVRGRLDELEGALLIVGGARNLRSRLDALEAAKPDAVLSDRLCDVEGRVLAIIRRLDPDRLEETLRDVLRRIDALEERPGIKRPMAHGERARLQQKAAHAESSLEFHDAVRQLAAFVKRSLDGGIIDRRAVKALVARIEAWLGGEGDG